MSEEIYCGFDLGGTKMLCVLMNAEQKIIARERKKTKGLDGGQAGIVRIVDLIRETMANAQVPIERVKSIGIGCPGPVDMEKGLVHVAVNLKWKNVPLGSILEEAFQKPVSVLNDVDAGVYGEYRCGVAKGAHSVAGLFPGTGIGGGFVYNGEILRGKSHTAMEIGHTRSLQTTKPAEHECPARWKAKQAASQSPRNARNWLTEMMPLSSRNSQVQISRRSEAKLCLLLSKVAMSKLRRWSGKERRCLDSPP